MFVVRKHVALLCCTFSRKVFVTIFNLGYTSNTIKYFLYHQLTFSDWSEDVKQNKTKKLSVLKSETCEPCPQSWMLPLHGKCSYSELFWSAFSCIRTEYGVILRIFQYLVRIWGNADQYNSEYGHFLRTQCTLHSDILRCTLYVATI